MAELQQTQGRLGDYRMQRADPSGTGAAIPDVMDIVQQHGGQPPANSAGAIPTAYESGSVAAPGGNYYAPGFVGGGLSDTGNAPPPGTGPGAGGGDRGSGLRRATVRELAPVGGGGGGGKFDSEARPPSVGEMSLGDLAQGISYADMGISAFDEAFGADNPASLATDFARTQQVAQLDKLTSAPDYVDAKGAAMGLDGGGREGTSVGDPTASMGGGRAGGVGTSGAGGGFDGSGGGLGEGESPSDAAGTPFARGGPVKGPGDGDDDAVSARLSNGEFVIQQPAAAALGEDVLTALNDPSVAARVGAMVRQEFMGGQSPMPTRNGLRNARAGGY